MTKHPVVNALLATFYIVVVGSVMYYGPKLNLHKDTVFIPIAVISLFTLSTAVMGYLFLYEPAQLYLDGQKKKAADLFLQTVVTFGVITAGILFVLFFFL